MNDMGLERPVPDFVEQNQVVIPGDAELDADELPRAIPLEADPADAAEQERVLDLDDDDYR
jgi:hypothetical protein